MVVDDWRRFLASQTEVVGGDLVHTEFPEGCFRGPIKSITVEGKQLIVVSDWVGRMAIDERGRHIGKHWENVTRPDALRAVYDLIDGIMSPPENIGQGRTRFTYAFAVCTIFPSGDSNKLRRSNVRGL